MKIKTGLVIIIFLGLISLTGCSEFQNESEKESEALVLKSYEVPERLIMDVARTVNGLLDFKQGKPDEDNAPLGKAIPAPDGQLLVAAPESFHDGLKDFIARVANSKPEPSLSTEVNYWIVAGRKAKTRAKLDEFTGIQPALDTIQNNQGNMEFKLLDHVVTTSSGQDARSKVIGSLSSINQQITADSNETLAIKTEIAINSGGGRWGSNNISTQIKIKNGELIVLGQSNQEFRGLSIFNPVKDEDEMRKHSEQVSVYYIISATVKK